MPNKPDPPPPDVKAFVDTLNRHRVEYVMIGGIAALLHGSSRATYDLDVLARGSLENLERLAAALTSIDAGQHLDSADLRGSSTRWDTSVGRVDVLLSARGLDGKMSITFRDVVDRRIDIVYDGTTIPVVALEDLIDMKTAVGRPHDLDTVSELRAIQANDTVTAEQLMDQWHVRRIHDDSPPPPEVGLDL